MFGLGWQEMLIILAVALLLFGGTRLAGLGKGTGRAIREFKEETRALREDEKAAKENTSATTTTTTTEGTATPSTTPTSAADDKPHQA